MATGCDSRAAALEFCLQNVHFHSSLSPTSVLMSSSRAVLYVPRWEEASGASTWSCTDKKLAPWNRRCATVRLSRKVTFCSGNRLKRSCIKHAARPIGTWSSCSSPPMGLSPPSSLTSAQTQRATTRHVVLLYAEHNFCSRSSKEPVAYLTSCVVFNARKISSSELFFT